MSVQIHLRLDGALNDEIRAYATAYGISIADAARILIRTGLAAATPAR